MKNIILAHYNENLDWISSINKEYNLFIYSKSNQNYHYEPVNKAQEAILYLKYIIDNYENLGDKNLFLHAHKTSYHQEYDADIIINHLNWNLAQFFSVTKRDCYFDEGLNENFNSRDYEWIKQTWGEVFGKYFLLPDTIHHYCCAQFQVDKELILNNSKEFYQHLYNWILKTNISNFITSRIFEHTWCYIFTKNKIEQKFDKILI